MKSSKKVNDIIVAVYFGPIAHTDSVDMEVVYEASYKDVEKWKYPAGGFSFWAFKNTIHDGGEYAAVHLPVPFVLSGNKPSPVDKFDYRGMFLMDPIGDGLLGNPGGDHGQHGCPVAIGGGALLNGRKSVCEGFMFNENRFVPLILPNWQTFYHITEIEGFWDEFDSKSHVISIDFPIQYDTTFGIYCTREVTYDEPKILKTRNRPN